MAKPSLQHLSRRERQIMDIVYRRGEVTAADVVDDLPDPPSYSAVRAHLRILEEKGYLRHRQQGPRYVYLPTVSHEKAKASALRHVVSTFFNGSVTQAMAALMDLGDELTPSELERLSRLIDDNKAEGR